MIDSGQRHGKDPMASRRNLLTRLPPLNNRNALAALVPCNGTPATSPITAASSA